MRKDLLRSCSDNSGSPQAVELLRSITEGLPLMAKGLEQLKIGLLCNQLVELINLLQNLATPRIRCHRDAYPYALVDRGEDADGESLGAVVVSLPGAP